MSRRVKKFSTGVIVLFCILSLVVGFVGGFLGYAYLTLPKDSDVYISGDLQFHFMELGNEHTGDSTYIKAGDVDILIDAGSETSSIPTICNYINNYITDNTIEYVIVTYAHEDHYAGFATKESEESIFDKYTIGTIIDFAQTEDGKTTKSMYLNYQRELNEAISRGAKHYTALDCVKEQNGASKTYELYGSITMTILEHRFYSEADADNENNHSVCTLFTQGDNNFLFTGDLDKEGEESLATINELPKCQLYKAGHHGSKTSSNECLLVEIDPEIVCVCCCAGNVEYTQKNENRFPTQEFIDRIAPYTDKIYVTTLGLITESRDEGGNIEYNSDGTIKYKNNGFQSFNGNIVVTSNKKGVKVDCSNNNTILKDTDWFKNNRTTPNAWLQSA